jgi:hypothetical protein
VRVALQRSVSKQVVCARDRKAMWMRQVEVITARCRLYSCVRVFACMCVFVCCAYVREGAFYECALNGDGSSVNTEKGMIAVVVIFGCKSEFFFNSKLTANYFIVLATWKM